MTGRRRRRVAAARVAMSPGAACRLREAQVLEQVLEGRTQHQIAEALGDQSAGGLENRRRVEERLLADLAVQGGAPARAADPAPGVHLRASDAGLASKQEGVLRRRQRKTEGGSGNGATVAELMSENRHGDPRYLDEARKALADRRKVWGVDAPERVAIDAVSPFASMSDEALEAAIARQTRLLQRTDAAAVTPVPSTNQAVGGAGMTQ